MGFLFIILGTLMWSLDTLIRYPLLGLIQPDTLVFIEHFFLTLIFIPVFFYKKLDFKKVRSNSLISFLVVGVIGSALSTLAFTKAFSLINPSLVILLQKLQPIVVIVFSMILLKEKIKKSFYFFAALAIFGGGLVSYPDLAPLFTSSADQKPGVVLGYLLTLFAVFGWGISTLFGKKLVIEGFTELEIMSGRFGAGFVFLFFYGLVNQSLPSTSLSGEIFVKTLALVLISGLCGMYLYYKGLKILSAHLGSIAELFFPFSAVLINWIFLGKTLEPIQIVGSSILILTSVAVQELKKQPIT